jgi:TRAP-type C4-dicarboxylate transport system permease small subunit
MHLSVDYLAPKLPSGLQKVVRAMVLVLVGFFSMILLVYGLKLLKVAALQVSPALGISMVWPYMALPVSGALMTLVTAWLIMNPQSAGRNGVDE